MTSNGRSKSGSLPSFVFWIGSIEGVEGEVLDCEVGLEDGFVDDEGDIVGCKEIDGFACCEKEGIADGEAVRVGLDDGEKEGLADDEAVWVGFDNTDGSIDGFSECEMVRVGLEDKLGFASGGLGDGEAVAVGFDDIAGPIDWFADGAALWSVVDGEKDGLTDGRPDRVDAGEEV